MITFSINKWTFESTIFVRHDVDVSYIQAHLPYGLHAVWEKASPTTQEFKTCFLWTRPRPCRDVSRRPIHLSKTRSLLWKLRIISSELQVYRKLPQNIISVYSIVFQPSVQCFSLHISDDKPRSLGRLTSRQVFYFTTFYFFTGSPISQTAERRPIKSTVVYQRLDPSCLSVALVSKRNNICEM